MGRPCVERSALLGCPIVTLIDPGNSAAAAADMVQNRFRHFKPHTKALQAGGDCAAQIVHAPRDKRRRACAGRAAALVRASMIALSSARFAFDQPAKGVPTAPGSTSAPCAPIAQGALGSFASSGSNAPRRSRAGALRGTM